MIRRPYILLLLIPAFVAGCASTQKKDEAFRHLNAQIDGLRASLEESRSKLDELNSKFGLLQEKVDVSRTRIEKMDWVEEAPPEGLKVISLGEQGPETSNAPAAKAARPAPAARPVPAPKASAAASPAAVKTGGKISGEGLNQKAQTPEEMYSMGQDLFLSGRYARAREVFLRLAREYPGHTLADNAIYWAGEAYYTEKDFSNALARFTEVAEKYPSENKAPDALLKAGFSSIEVKDNRRARGFLKELVRRYPYSEAAGKARKALASLSAGQP
ncbi:MAG: tol-pal system protein YbgF [Thermodesulfobacteriota bacterium]